MTSDDRTAAPPPGGAAPRTHTDQQRPGGRGAGEGRKTAVENAKEARRAARRSRRYRLDEKLSPYGFIAPFFLFFAAFGFFPLLYTGWASLHRVTLHQPTDMEWAGLHNYARLLEDEFFWNALRNTFTIGVISTVPQLLMALGLAHLLHYKLRGSMFFRVVMLTPYATSVAAATLVFAMLYGRDFGMINWLLDQVGIDPVDWKNDTWASQFAVSSIVIWRWTGYNALIYLAAMQAVPQDRYESAAVDGASRWQQFVHITIPALRPTILFTVVVSTIGATQLFGEPLLFAGQQTGGPSHQYQTLGLYLYEQGWFNFNLGRASAIAWTMFLILVVIGLLNWAIARWIGRSQGREG